MKTINHTKLSLFKWELIPLILLSTLIVLTAFTSIGHHHPDEFYQILEYGSYVINDLPSKFRLAWEFDAQIRPSIQVWLTVLFIKPFSSISVSPFYQVTFFRLLSGLFSIITFRQVFKYIKRNYSEVNTLTVLLLIPFCLWFYPYIAVRFSSETWSGNFFFLGLFYFLNNYKNNPKNLLLITGVLHGLSFLFRFQSGFLILGFGLWLLFHLKDNKFKQISTYILLLCCCIGIGVVLDSFFYKNLVFTPWNYFKVNILEDKASKFGVESSFFYLKSIVEKSFYPIGLVIVSSLVVFLWKNPTHLITWVFIPFLFIHHIIPHKEERFIFPLIFALPVILAFAISKFDLLKNSLFIYLFIALNAILVVFSFTRPARVDVVLLKAYSEVNTTDSIILHDTPSPYPVFNIYGISNSFYHQHHKQPASKRIVNFKGITPEDFSKKVLFIQTLQKNPFKENTFLQQHCKKIYATLPKWVIDLNLGFRQKSIAKTMTGFYKCNCEIE